MHFFKGTNNIGIQFTRDKDSKQLSIAIRDGSLPDNLPLFHNVTKNVQVDVCIFRTIEDSIPLAQCYPSDEELGDIISLFIKGNTVLGID
jgi:hypothetical protein